MLVLLLVLLALVPVYYLVAGFLQYQKNKQALKDIPGREQFICHSSFFLRIPFLKCLFPGYVSTEWPHKLHLDFQQLNTNIIKMASSSKSCTIFVNDPALIKEIMVKNWKSYPKPSHNYSILKIWGENIVSAPDGPIWKKHRLLCNPSFTESNYRLVADITAKLTNQLFDIWNKKASQNYIHTFIDDDMVRLTLAVICEAGFGQNFSLFEEKESEKGRLSFKRSLMMVSRNLVWKLLFPDFFFRIPFTKFHEVGIAFDQFGEYMNEIVKSRRAQQKEENQPPKNDLLNILISSQEAEFGSLTTQEILSDSFIFFVAGHETTAHTLSFSYALLATHDDIQRKLYSEVMEVLGTRQPVYEDFEKLIYCKAVFKETLRLYPPVSTIPKYTPNDIELAGNHLPAGTIVDISVIGVHRSPLYWENPEQFNPDRFDPRVTGSATIDSFTFLPFSLGPRSCIGMKFSQVEGVIALAMVVQKYVLRIPEGVDLQKAWQTHSLLTTEFVYPFKLELVPRPAA